MGIRVVMLTGDNEGTAAAIGKQAGVDNVVAGVLPEGKEQIIRSLAECGKTAMVGDGINDAPALTRADIGVAIGAGTDVAIDAADVVLVRSRLSDVSAAVRLSRAVLRNIHENLFWAFIYNIIGIPLAAGLFTPIFGWTLDPMFGAAAMSLSSFCVVTNALRLNLKNIRDPRRDKRRAPVDIDIPALRTPEAAVSCACEAERETAKRILHIEGMMCGHCERTVKAALEAIPGVIGAEASFEMGIAEIILSGDVPDEALIKAVEAEDYEVISVE